MKISPIKRIPHNWLMCFGFECGQYEINEYTYVQTSSSVAFTDIVNRKHNIQTTQTKPTRTAEKKTTTRNGCTRTHNSYAPFGIIFVHTPFNGNNFVNLLQFER